VAVLDEMLESPTDIGLQSTPLPNTSTAFTWLFMSSMVPFLQVVWIFGAITEIMKEIVGRGLGL
jgi:hypothetical protein